MVISYVKIKYKTKKQKEMLFKLKDIKDTIKDGVLSKYLDKCKIQNALKFFEWRAKLRNKHMDKN
jgi:hypothetical protein